MKKGTSWFNRLHSVTRLLLCLGIAAVVLAVALYFGLPILTGIVLAWAVFSLGMIALSWTTFFSISDIDLYLESRREDESGPVIFLIVLLSVCISLSGILILMHNTNESLIMKGLHQAISLLSVALSWILLHTIFTLHYARLYYADDPAGKAEQAGGLSFPDEVKPDYLDFAYFSFVIGMTFQVSDVEISGRHLRRLVLLHSFISFVFNTIIVALTISVLSSAGK
jgi:uncharacterized membrane protein